MSKEFTADEHFFDGLIGQNCGPRTMTYGWRDVSLYALGVGAGKYDLPYFFEKYKGGMKALHLTPMMTSSAWWQWIS